MPGYDSLPLTRLIRLGRCRDLPMPGPLVGPIYAARRRLLGRDFDYRLNRWRFHFNGVLDGRRARRELGYEPNHPLLWR